MSGNSQSKITLGPDNPWPGLNQFLEDHDRYFRGRDEEKVELFRLVKSEILTILFGKSGLGKSSLLQAGLFPLLRQAGYLPVFIHIRYDDPATDDRSGASLLSSQVYAALREACAASKVEAPEIRDEETLWEYFHRAGAAFWSERNRLVTPVLVFDQFEEAFTLGVETDWRRKRRDALLVQLEELIENRPPQTLRRRWNEDPELVSDFEQDRTPCKIILSLREDFLPDLEQLKERIRSIMQNRFRLERMDGSKAWQVVTGETMIDGEPCRTLSHLVDEEVALKIIDFVSKTRGQRDQAALTRENLRSRTVDPALLSVVCSELNNRRRAKNLPQEKISFTLLSDSKEEIIREFFDSHVNALGAGAGPVRRFIEEDLITGGGFRKRCDLDDALQQQGVTRDDLRRLEQQRILRFEPSEGITWVELTHDLLTEVVYASRRQRREREGRAQAERQQREAEEKVRVARRRFAFVTVLLGLAVVAAIFGFWQAKLARDAQAEAERNRNQAQSTRAQADVAIALVYQQRDDAVDPRSLAHLARALRTLPNAPLPRQYVVSLFRDRLWYLASTELGHDAEVKDASFSADGARIVTACFDNTARIWDANTGKQVGEPLRHEGRVNAASFSADGARIVTACSDNTARIWDANAGKEVGEPLRHEGRVNAASFSADGARIVTASSDRTARIWDANTGQPVGEPLRHEAPVNGASFSADGARIVTACSDRTALIWDAKNGQQLGVILGHDAPVGAASFSADGVRIVTASDDKTARIWDAKTGQQMGKSLRHDAAVNDARFSADGARIVTASDDKTARIWNAKTGEPVGEPLRHGAEVYAASFSTDGARIVTASFDKTAQIWDTRNGQLVGEPLRRKAPVNTASLSADGARIVTLSADNTARIWDAKTGQPVGETLRHEDAIRAASFSADGARVVTLSANNTARIWDAKTGQPVGETLYHVCAAYGAGIVTASAKNTARIWDAKTGQPVAVSLGHDAAVCAASADGARIVTLSDDQRTARIWDAKTGQALGEPLGHKAPVNAASFSADGARIITVSADNTARLWDLINRERSLS